MSPFYEPEPSQDPYTYPNSAVLRNKLDLRTDAQLEPVETGCSTARVLELKANPIKGNYDLAHLQAIHKHIFQDVYEWAGKLRSITISKDGSMFARPDYIKSYGDNVFKDLNKENNLKGLPQDKFIDRISSLYGEINSLHPFREGNGRATQLFLSSLAKEAGYHIDFAKVDKDRWNQAAKDSHDGKMEPVKKIFGEITATLEIAKSRALAAAEAGKLAEVQKRLAGHIQDIQKYQSNNPPSASKGLGRKGIDPSQRD